ncbi:hypothetical protein [Rubrivirga sp.]|uniref:hypothetical protein n=1 Tax=Rubrivirga sp. TaxID=1885344 RepID=UPI003C7491BE
MAVTDLPDSISFPPAGDRPSARRRGGWPPPAGTLPVVIGVLVLTSLLLGAALLVALSDARASAPSAVDLEAVESDATAAPDPVAPIAATATSAPLSPPSVANFPADPSPIPVDLLTRLEGASDSPLETELGFLLDAVQHGFSRNSARLEPTLRSYVYRMTSRFVWNPESFRIAVTAPDPELAAARGELLKSLFEDAVATGRLDVGTGTGPHALMVIPD